MEIQHGKTYRTRVGDRVTLYWNPSFHVWVADPEHTKKTKAIDVKFWWANGRFHLEIECHEDIVTEDVARPTRDTFWMLAPNKLYKCVWIAQPLKKAVFVYWFGEESTSLETLTLSFDEFADRVHMYEK